MNPKIILYSSLALALAACGQTPTAGGTGGTASTQLVSGTVTALSADHGTLTVAGNTLHLSGTSTVGTQSVLPLAAKSQATVRINGKTVTPKALSVGQQVSVTVENNVVTSVDVDLALRGRVESVDASAGILVVAGQTVLVNGDTRVELATDDDTSAQTGHTLADLQGGMFVEVTGARAADGQVVASKIEVKDHEELAEEDQGEEIEVRGMVSGLDTAAKTFRIGGLTVNFAATTLPAGLANGAQVEVEGALDAKTPNLLNATGVKLEGKRSGHEHGHPNASVVMEGRLTDLDAKAQIFRLNDFTVGFARAQVNGQLKGGVKVKVVGKVNATDSGLINAQLVKVEPEKSHDD